MWRTLRIGCSFAIEVSAIFHQQPVCFKYFCYYYHQYTTRCYFLVTTKCNIDTLSCHPTICLLYSSIYTIQQFTYTAYLYQYLCPYLRPYLCPYLCPYLLHYLCHYLSQYQSTATHWDSKRVSLAVYWLYSFYLHALSTDLSIVLSIDLA